LSNKRKNKLKKWQELVFKFESRSISATEFSKLHSVSKGSLYKWRRYFLDNQTCSEDPSFIPLEIKQNNYSNSCKDEIILCSAFKVSNSTGLTIEFTNGCKMFELNAIIEVINATE